MFLFICRADRNRRPSCSIHGKIDNHGIGFSFFDCRTFCHLQNARSASVPACDQIAATPEFHRRRNLICHLIADNLNYTLGVIPIEAQVGHRGNAAALDRMCRNRKKHHQNKRHAKETLFH